MDRRQENYVLLAIIVGLLLLGLYIHYGDAQVLQRRTEPVLQPKSCRQIMADNRKTFAVAAKVEVSPVTKKDLRQMADDLSDERIVQWICENPKLVGMVNLQAADAEYRMRVEK